MKQPKLLLIALLFLTLSLPSIAQVRNVIFIIGDGMGISQVQAASTLKGSPLVLQQFPYTAFQYTHSANDYITDSAAGGTALACGSKTNNGMIGVDTLGTPLQSILTLSHLNGLATGIVTTCDITHATPASYYAHDNSRGNTQAIAAFLPQSGVDVVIAGGRDNMRKRKDNRDLVAEMQKGGYQYATTIEEATAIQGNKILALVADEHPQTITEGRGDYLSQSVALAIDKLKDNRKGFFLMVEGSQIDWGGHANDETYNTNETLDLDKAIAVALEFARKDKHTLVVVTADHETGGLVILKGNYKQHELTTKYNTKGHTGSYVPIYAYGPEADQYHGFIDNTEHKARLTKALKLRTK